MLTSVENCDYFVYIHLVNILQITEFLFYKKNETFVLTVDLCFSCSFHFIIVLFYELNFLKNYVTYPN
jgi:hypothetical protein